MWCKFSELPSSNLRVYEAVAVYAIYLYLLSTVVNQYSGLFHYSSVGGGTARTGGLRATLCFDSLVEVN